MFSKKPESAEKSELSKTKPEQAPEKLRYMRYYEHDGALRAYANRVLLLALISIPTALIAVGLAAYVRLQPPTVIRVNADEIYPNHGQITCAEEVHSLCIRSWRGIASVRNLQRSLMLRAALQHVLEYRKCDCRKHKKYGYPRAQRRFR
jgi:hypothetical protein